MSASAAWPTVLATDKPRCPRRATPLSLRLFVAMLVISGGGSVLWVGFPIYREQQVIQKVEGWGGRVEKHPAGSNWMFKTLGSHRLKSLRVFDRVISVELSGTQITDADLANLSVFTNLTHLDLEGTSVTDAGLPRLSALLNLLMLSLGRTQVTDVGLVHLSGLKHLEFLFLDATAVTDSGLVHLSSLTSIRNLRLNGTEVTDA